MSRRIRGVAQTGFTVKMKIALIQFNAGPDRNENIRRALSFVDRAADAGAKFVLLPEVFHYRGDLLKRTNFLLACEKIPGASTEPFMALAAKRKINILAGSIIEKSANSNKAYNTSLLINAKGSIAAQYRKINLFEAKLKGAKLDESRVFLKGNKPAIGHVGEFRVGLSICYDLRFPDLFQNYKKLGAHILTVPSCFTKMTGQAHWEVLVRARAIETQCYVLAPNQIGMDARGVYSYGNSLIVNPWGEILGRGSDNKEEIITAEISLRELKKTQKVLPGFRKTV